jgi:hypothetical protein
MKQILPFLTLAGVLLASNALAQVMPGTGFDPKFAKPRMQEILPSNEMKSLPGLDASKLCFVFRDPGEGKTVTFSGKRPAFLYTNTACKKGNSENLVFGPEADLQKAERVLPMVIRPFDTSGKVWVDAQVPEYNVTYMPVTVSKDLKSEGPGRLAFMLRDEHIKPTPIEVATVEAHPTEKNVWIFTSFCQLAASKDKAPFRKNCSLGLNQQNQLELRLRGEVVDNILVSLKK